MTLRGPSLLNCDGQGMQIILSHNTCDRVAIMVKERKHIPKSTSDQVLGEFNHRCAICGSDKPQIHHIDEDPSNIELLNLIPLCPNCHLVDQHNPTRSIPPERLRLFREFKDPTILKAQFHPLWTRLTFLDSIEDDSDISELEERSKDLIHFVAALEMGTPYSKRIGKLVKRSHWFVIAAGQPELFRKQQLDQAREYRDKLRRARDQVYTLVVELLRFQRW